jgi:hypothetical protein
MTTNTTKTKTPRIILWEDPAAKTFDVFGWVTHSGVVWKLNPKTPARLFGTHDLHVQVTASAKFLDSDVLSELNRHFSF